MRWTTVIQAVTVRRTMMMPSTHPSSARPKNACGADSRTTRSGRCSMPDLRVDAERLGAGARVRREERADETEQRDDHHRHAVMHADCSA